MKKNNYLNMLGLAYRAGKCSLGEEAIVKDIQTSRAKLVLLASDIGAQTRKKLINKCAYYNVPYAIIDDRDTLSKAIGKTQRVAVAILDDGFAAKLKTLLSGK